MNQQDIFLLASPFSTMAVSPFPSATIEQYPTPHTHLFLHRKKASYLPLNEKKIDKHPKKTQPEPSHTSYFSKNSPLLES